MSDQSEFYSAAAQAALGTRLRVPQNQIKVLSVSKELHAHERGSVDLSPIYQYTVTLEAGTGTYRYTGLRGTVSPA